MQSILFIGFGTMGSAIARSLRKRNKYRIVTVDPLDTSRKLAQKMNIEHCSNMEEAQRYFSEENLIVLLAVKPQNAQEICVQLSSKLTKNHSVFSIMAGVPSSVLTSILNTERVVRFMPTIGANSGKSVTGIYIVLGKSDPALCELAQHFANSFGTSYVFTKEEHIAAITGLSGSGIAFITAFLDALILAGIREGLSKDDAQNIAISTMESVCTMLSKNSKGKKTVFSSPSECIQAISSPAGTTIEGIHTLHSQSFYATVMDAVHSARQKADTIERK